MATDPGWVPALGNFWRYLFFPTWQQRSQRVQQMPLLVWLRTMTLVAPTTWLAFLIVLLVIRRANTRPKNGEVLAIIVAGAGVACVLAVLLLRRKRASGNDAVSVAFRFRGRFFLGWAVSGMPALVGFIVFFEGARLTAFFIGAIFGFIAIVINAPTRARLEADQGRLRAAHSDVQLSDALMVPNAHVPIRAPRK